MSINDIHYWTNLKSSDEILDSYETSKRSILAGDPSSYSNLVNRWISVDPNCMAKKGNLEYQCGSCLLLDRLGVTSTGIINLEIGKKKGTKLIVKDVPNSTLYLKMDPLKRTLYTTEFTQRLLGSWLLERAGIPILPVYTGFICGKDGYLIYDLPDTVVEPGSTNGELLGKLDQLNFRCDTDEDLFYLVGSEVKFRVPGCCRFKVDGIWVQNSNYTHGVKLSQLPKNVRAEDV